ncbi:MAG: Stp1/IreP family PP2C-type Ser/Thr phosphatase [Actinomycetota bacterium]|nr:Stp1/IreP family PP2C-type Ser/Thr phosphatase [Actinomycetota bacterium]
MEYYALSDIGKFRSSNEDSYYAEKDLLIVADGMGGHNAGEVASKYAITYFVEHFQSLLSNKPEANGKAIQIEKANNISKKISKNSNADEIQKMMVESIEYANTKIYKMGLENEEYSGMGTTFTCLFIKNEKCYVAHVGDSRLYLYRNSELSLLTEDHTFVFALYKKGAITYEELFTHPQKNYLTGIIGENDISSLECFKFDLLKNDIIFICSDGLSSMVYDDSIRKILDKSKSKSPREIAENLVKKAIKNGGNDNITVIVIKN